MSSEARFVRSAGRPADFIRDDRPMVVFAGRSNVGKSSVINCLLNRKNLARVGSEPGKTASVNYFLAGEKVWFVDLPGYGYARVSQEEQARWARLMEDFFAEGERIRLGLCLVDARHSPTELDRQMAGLFLRCGCGLAVAANKWDKLKKSQTQSSLEQIRQGLALEEGTELIPFSARTRLGRRELLGVIARWCDTI